MEWAISILCREFELIEVYLCKKIKENVSLNRMPSIKSKSSNKIFYKNDNAML